MKNNVDVDVYVLAIIDGNTVNFPGYATKKELINPDNVTDLGFGKGYALKQNELRSWKDK